MATGKNAEGRAGIAHVSEIKKSVDDWNRMVQRHHPVDDNFRQLIENDNRYQPTQNELPFSAQAAAPAWSTPAQRGQTVGYAESLPTSGSYFQQRSHLAPAALATTMRQFNNVAS